jgi:heparin binding hemagglutinin HbhA
MSITSDIRSYADTAVSQGKQVLDQAQAQLNDVTGQANEFVGKLTDTAKTNYSELSTKATTAATDFRAQAEKALNLDAIKSAVEPYLAQAKDYSASVTDRATGIVDSVKADKRVSSLVSTVETVSGTVVETVTERVIKPVQSLTGLGAKPAPVKAAAPKPTPVKAAPKPAPAKAAAKKAPAKKAPAKKAAK